MDILKRDTKLCSQLEVFYIHVRLSNIVIYTYDSCIVLLVLLVFTWSNYLDMFAIKGSWAEIGKTL